MKEEQELNSCSVPLQNPMPEMGLEPIHSLEHRDLKPACLPNSTILAINRGRKTASIPKTGFEPVNPWALVFETSVSTVPPLRLGCHGS